jgi:hypothetical protein
MHLGQHLGQHVGQHLGALGGAIVIADPLPNELRVHHDEVALRCAAAPDLVVVHQSVTIRVIHG